MSGATSLVDPDRLAIRNVTLIYPSRRRTDREVAPAVRDVSLEVRRGEFVALVGASGCGKTSLLNMVAGLVVPTEGHVSVFGSDPSSGSRSDIGYMFARDCLLPWRTARRNVELTLESRSMSRRERRDRSLEMLRMVGLEGYENHYPAQLSQGMRQRVALARTFVARPSILLMDEPFAALDAQTRLTIQREFLRIWESTISSSSPTTVVFVTHDLSEAVLLADQVVVMLPHPGRIAESLSSEFVRPRAERLHEVLFSTEFSSVTRGLFERLEGAIEPGRTNG